MYHFFPPREGGGGGGKTDMMRRSGRVGPNEGQAQGGGTGKERDREGGKARPGSDTAFSVLTPGINL